MDGDVWMFGDRPGERRAFVADEIDLDAARGERACVVLHPGASAEIGERKNDGAHVGVRNREGSVIITVPTS